MVYNRQKVLAKRTSICEIGEFLEYEAEIRESDNEINIC